VAPAPCPQGCCREREDHPPRRGRLRDAFYLRYGDDPGPAGRILAAWRALTTALDDEVVARVAGLLDLKIDDGLRAAIHSAQQLVFDLDASSRGAPFAAAEAARLLFRCRPDAEVLALWLADAVLAIRLKWPLPLPLIAGALLHPSLRTLSGSVHDGGGDRRRPSLGDPNWMHSCVLAYAHAAIHACDLFADLERKAQKLAAVSPRLRAKGAGAVIERLHNEDALFLSKAQMTKAGTMSVGGGVTMSTRSMRRLFARLAALGAVRELTGRSTFRLYGL
jgi:hypothetical protein